MSSLSPINHYPSFQTPNFLDLNLCARIVTRDWSPPTRIHSLTPGPKSPSTSPPCTVSTAPPPQQLLPQTQSPLFATLPVEIRRLIYTELLGGDGGRVHIVYEPIRLRRLVAYKSLFAVSKHGYTTCLRGHKFNSSNGETSSSPGMHFLSLITACRRLHAEAIDLLYSVPTFLVDSVFFLPFWLETTLAHRFQSIRSLDFALKTHQFMGWGSRLREGMWQSTWAIIAGMKGLRTLRVVLSSLVIEKSVTRAMEREAFAPLACVKGVPKFEVTVDWQLSDGDEEEDDWPFRLVRRVRKT